MSGRSPGRYGGGGEDGIFAFYHRRWRSDARLQGCSLAARGMLIEVMSLIADGSEPGALTEGGKPWSRDRVARVVAGETRENLAALEELIESGVLTIRADGAIFSKRMAEVMRLRRARQAAGRRGGVGDSEAESQEDREAKGPEIGKQKAPKSGSKRPRNREAKGPEIGKQKAHFGEQNGVGRGDIGGYRVQGTGYPPPETHHPKLGTGYNENTQEETMGGGYKGGPGGIEPEIQGVEDWSGEPLEDVYLDNERPGAGRWGGKRLMEDGNATPAERSDRVSCWDDEAGKKAMLSRARDFIRFMTVSGIRSGQATGSDQHVRAIAARMHDVTPEAFESAIKWAIERIGDGNNRADLTAILTFPDGCMPSGRGPDRIARMIREMESKT